MTYQTDRRARGGLPRDGRPRGVTLPPPLRAALSAPRSVFPPALLGLVAVSRPPCRLQAFPSPSAPHCGSLTPHPSLGRRAAVLARCLSRSLFRLRFSSHAYSCLCTDVPSPSLVCLSFWLWCPHLHPSTDQSCGREWGEPDAPAEALTAHCCHQGTCRSQEETQGRVYSHLNTVITAASSFNSFPFFL